MSNAVTMQRANVVLQVPEHEVEKYFAQGYSLIDEEGNVIKESVPNDLGTLQKAFVDHTKKIEELQKQLEELQKQSEQKSTRGRKKTESE